MDIRIGNVYGELLVVEILKGRKVKCSCSCGTIKLVRSDHLKSGLTKSCGCLRNRPSSRRQDLTGQRFGKLTVISPDKMKDNSHGWMCQCDCGGTKVVTASSLNGGMIKSCGCLYRNMILSSDERKADRRFSEYYDWRLIVIARDNYTCIKCGSVGKNLHVHHLEDYSSNISLRTEPTNGITVCAKCHRLFHKIYGKRGVNTALQFVEFLED